MTDPLKDFQKPLVNTQDAPPEKNDIKSDLSTFTDDRLFPFLSDKTGRDIKSWDDLNPKEIEKVVDRPVPVSYANDEVANFDRYVKETGRGIGDYMKMTRDLEKVPQDKLVKEMLQAEYPALDANDISELYDSRFRLNEVNEEEMDEQLSRDLKEKNKTRELELKLYAHKALRYFNEEKEKFKMPDASKEDTAKAGAMAWKEKMGDAIGRFKAFESEGFKYEVADMERYKNLTDISTVFDTFKTGDGTIDYEKLAKTLVAGSEFESVLAAHRKFVEETTKESIMKEFSNHRGALQREVVPNDDAARERHNNAVIFKNNTKY